MLLEDYKKYPKVCCIYEIINTVTTQKYIGSCIDLRARFIRHMWYLNHNKHHSNKLQRAFNKYTINSFNVNIIEKFEVKENLEILEESLIKKYNTVINGYNIVYNTNQYHGGKKLKEDQINKRLEHSKKPVLCFNRYTGELINEFDSVSKASKFYKTSTSNISRVCKKELNYIKNTVFRYKSKYNNENVIYSKHHNYKVPKSLEIRNKMIISNKKSIKITQYDVNMKIIKIYLSKNQCIKETGFGDYKIRQAIKNQTPLFGYYFIQENKI